MTNRHDVDSEARRAWFEREWQRSIDSYTGDPDANTYGCSHQEAGWLMFNAALDSVAAPVPQQRGGGEGAERGVLGGA